MNGIGISPNAGGVSMFDIDAPYITVRHENQRRVSAR